jgi:hypothetical protein
MSRWDNSEKLTISGRNHGIRGLCTNMLSTAIISVLLGMVLGQRFKVLILAPAILLTLLGALGASIVRPETVWFIGKAAAEAIVGMQIGYLLGLGIRHLTLLARAARLRGASPANSFVPRHPAH